LKEKPVGTEALFIATQLSGRINAALYPDVGFAVVEAMTYCFDRPHHGRKPDVAFVRLDRLPGRAIPTGDLRLAPDLVVEVLSPGNTGIEVQTKLDEYLEAGVPLVWIVNPDPRTIRAYRNDGTTRLYRTTDVVEQEPGLPGFRFAVADIFPRPVTKAPQAGELPGHDPNAPPKAP
jgi:Uma2 family endonuclease